MLRINNIKLEIGADEGRLKEKACKILRIGPEKIKSIRISGKSIDARDKNNIFCVYSVDLAVSLPESRFSGFKNVRIIHETEKESQKRSKKPAHRPIVAGSGPCGLFAALILARAGLCPIIIERGKPVNERKADAESFFAGGGLNENSNIQFGEGGAGAFSDGKLTTGINNPLTAYVLEEFVKFSAPEEILYLSKPHIGTDRLMDVILAIRREIEGLGGEYRFSTRLTDIIAENGALRAVETENLKDGSRSIIETRHAVLAVGHSARDVFERLYELGIRMEQKAFSVGLRVEHLQKQINISQYGKFAEKLPPAEYKLSTVLPGKRGAYTFCMCPGGLVVPAASEAGGVVTNGMSYYKRDLENANSALLVSVFPGDFPDKSPLAGIAFQRELESKAFTQGGGGHKAPCQLIGDFLKGETSEGYGGVLPTYRPGVTKSDFNAWLPVFIAEGLKQAITDMDRKLRGFAVYDGVLTGVESRSSSPLRIIRDEEFNSSIKGLYPAGEGAGHAGGIMSSAVDGIKCAKKLINAIN